MVPGAAGIRIDGHQIAADVDLRLGRFIPLVRFFLALSADLFLAPSRGSGRRSIR